LRVHHAGYLAGKACTYGPVKAVVGKQHPYRYDLQYQESKKGKIPADEKEDVAHGKKLQAASIKLQVM
jgi:hypothetical protein